MNRREFLISAGAVVATGVTTAPRFKWGAVMDARPRHVSPYAVFESIDLQDYGGELPGLDWEVTT